MPIFVKIKRQARAVIYAIFLIYLGRACVDIIVEVLTNSLEETQSKNSSNLFSQENPYQNKKMVKEKFSHQKNPVILIWTLPWKFKNGIEFTAKEEYGSCKITTDRSKFKESMAVVIFNNYKKMVKGDWPNLDARNPEQTFVFWTAETPAKTFRFKNLLENPLYDSIFNLSMSLMPTADIQAVFGSFRRAVIKSHQQKLSSDKSSPLWKKTKLAVWALSNCYGLPAATERLLLAKSLVKAGLKLDKFGKCFGNTEKLSRTSEYFEEYKFYLAFENSYHCPSYITEKFWRNSLEYGLVPIVWGPTKEDVLNVAPPNSFIFAEDFKNPRALVKYLNYLNRNYTAYMEYHKWRETSPTLIPPDRTAKGDFELLSKLCQRLVKEKHQPKMIKSISKLIYETGYADKKCLRPFSNLTKQEQKEILNF